MSAPDLSSLRDRIEAVDRQIISLLAERLKIVEDVAAAKLSSASPFRDREREELLLQRLRAQATGAGLDPHQVERMYRVVMDMSVAHQEATVRSREDVPLRITYQGVEGSYSHLAAQKRYAGRVGGALLAGHDTFRGAAEAVIAGTADLALLPIENTTAGSINQVYDLLQAADVHVVGEETWRVDHCLAAIGDVPLSSLSRVLSHPQGLEQCAGFLRTLPGAAPVIVFDTAEAMRAVAEQADPTWAGIGSPEAAEAHGLVVLRRGLADRAENWTRFLLLARNPVRVPERVPSKTSLVLVTSHEEGALLRCLEILSRSKHSLTKLESRPRPGRPFEYLFFLDFEGNVADPRTQTVLDQLREATLALKVLGSYPAKVVRTGAPDGDALEAVLGPEGRGAARRWPQS